MPELHDALNSALHKLRKLSGKIQVMLADASALSFDVEDVVEDIRNEAFELVDACDATEDGFADMDDDYYFNREDD